MKRSMIIFQTKNMHAQFPARPVGQAGIRPLKKQKIYE